MLMLKLNIIKEVLKALFYFSTFIRFLGFTFGDINDQFQAEQIWKKEGQR